jgi:hypothetical protein
MVIEKGIKQGLDNRAEVKQRRDFREKDNRKGILMKGVIKKRCNRGEV